MHLKWRKTQLKKEARGVRYRTEHLTGLVTATLSRILSYLDLSEANARPPPP